MLSQVEATAGYGVPEADIARVLNIDAKTLRKHYRDELDTGHVKANAKVAENLFRKATGEGRESVIAAIFWLKVRAHWKLTSVTEITGKDSGAIDFEHFSAEELRAWIVSEARELGLPLAADASPDTTAMAVRPGAAGRRR